MAPFTNYAPGAGYDEMFASKGVPRPHYREIFETLQASPPEELADRKRAADLAFLHLRITFTVYGEGGGTERIFPFDPIPRVLTRRKWERIEAGLMDGLPWFNLTRAQVAGDPKNLLPAARSIVSVGISYLCDGEVDASRPGAPCGRIARYAYPIWLYVSASGVIVYLLLYQLFPAK